MSALLVALCQYVSTEDTIMMCFVIKFAHTGNVSKVRVGSKVVSLITKESDTEDTLVTRASSFVLAMEDVGRIMTSLWNDGNMV